MIPDIDCHLPIFNFQFSIFNNPQNFRTHAHSEEPEMRTAAPTLLPHSGMYANRGWDGAGLATPPEDRGSKPGDFAERHRFSVPAALADWRRRPEAEEGSALHSHCAEVQRVFASKLSRDLRPALQYRIPLMNAPHPSSCQQERQAVRGRATMRRRLTRRPVSSLVPKSNRS